MAQNEVEFLFKARDEVSAQLAKINQQIAATGTAIAGTTAKGEGFSAWIREQRTQQRTMNFLFREGSAAVGTLAIGLTALNGATLGASSSTKQMTNALTQGFAAFAALEFSLGSLLGPWGMLVAAIGGATFGLAAYNAEQQKAIQINKELAASNRLLAAEIGGWDTEVITELGKQYQEAKKELDAFTTRSNFSVEDYNRAVNKKLRAEKAYNDALKNLGKGVTDIINKGAEENAKAAEKRARAAEEEKRAFEALYARVFPLQVKQSELINDRIALYQKLGAAAIDAIQKESALGRSAVELPKVQENQPAFLTPTLTLQEEVIANFLQMGTLAEQVGGTITNTMTNAAEIMAGVMTGAIERIDQAFKALIQSMLAELIKIGLIKLFSGLLTGGVSSAVGAIGSTFAKTAARPVPEEEGTPTAKTKAKVEEEPKKEVVQPKTETVYNVTINVTPDSRTVSVADRRRTMRTIEQAIFTEK